MPHPLTHQLPALLSGSPDWGASITHDGVAMRSFRAATTPWQDGAITTYGLYGEPPGDEPVPGILHLHGGGQTASPEQVAIWVKRGYACLSFDWTGPRDERPQEQVAHFPQGFPGEANWLAAIDNTGSLYSSYFHGLIAARHMLGILTRQARVDAKRIGAYGISWGGFLTWLLNSIDSRLHAACAIYGTGGLHWPGHIWEDAWAGIGAPARQRWLSLIEPRTHVPFQQAPIAFLNGTNDFFGGLDVASEMLPMIPQPWRADFSPNSDHHISGGGAVLLERWMDHHLRGGPALPPAPELRVERQERQLICTAALTTDVELWYSQGDRPHRTRHWEVRHDWQDGRLELDIAGDTWLYVRQRFADGLSLSSAPLCLSGTGAPTAGQVVWQAPSRAGIGIYMSTQPEMAGDSDEVYELTADGLTTRQPDEELTLLVQLPPGRTGHAFELDLEDCAEVELNAHLQGDTATASPSAAGTCTVELPTTPNSLLVRLRPEAGQRPRLKAIRWVSDGTRSRSSW